MANRFYELTVAGCKRSLPILNVTDKLAIAGFIMLGDTELVEECAKVLVTKLPADIDYLICPEAKAIPLAHAMARMMGINYIVIRKSVKVYMENPLIVDVQSITTAGQQHLVMDSADVQKIWHKRVAIVDDYTGNSFQFTANAVDYDGNVYIDLGGYGSGVFSPCSVSDVISIMDSIETYGYDLKYW